jgi:tRNA-specific 2-thiouridylase
MKKKRVVIGLSGGVDSSVAAALLVEQGYDVIGVYVLGYWGDDEYVCAWQPEEQDARLVANKLNIPFYTVNLSQEYKKKVIDDFIDKYRQGLTPNPDVLCNSEIKFRALPELIRQFEPDFLATGHYAAIVNGTTKNALIAHPKDTSKDQTYFLWRLDKQILAKLIFPLGLLTKDETRQLAKKYDLPTQNKKDSQGVCFIGPLNVRKFLHRYLQPKEGEAVLSDGRVIAKHEGAVMYTIGQRLSAGSVNWTGDVPPLYVIAKDLKNNRLIVGDDKATLRQTLTAKELNWHLLPPKKHFTAEAQIRYRQRAVEAQFELENGCIHVEFKEPVRAVTPGQSLVIYKDNCLIGGGVID